MKVHSEVAVKLARLGLNAPMIEKLVKIAHRLTTLDVRYSNGEGWGWENERATWNDSDQARYDRTTERLFDKAVGIVGAAVNAGAYGGIKTIAKRAKISHQRDPRGSSLKIEHNGSEFGIY